MPIYSYKCKKCGRVFDEFQKAGEGNGSNNNIKCIYCNTDAHRLFSSVGIIFKGSGFYTTDYKSSSVNLNNSGGSTGKERGLKKSESKTTDNKTTDNKKETVEKETGTIPNKAS